MFSKIIHQTWKNENDFKKFSDTWKNKNPDFEYRFYNDFDCYKFIKNNYKEFLNLYEKLTNVQKADIFRYLILHKHGGFYADIDTTCLKSLNDLLTEKKSLITGVEYHNKQLLQWFIGSVKNNQILYELVKRIEYNYNYSWTYLFMSNNEKTYSLTGPKIFTEVLLENRNKIRIKPKGILGSYDKKLINEKSYLVHHFFGTWK